MKLTEVYILKESVCPACNHNGAYIGFNSVECINKNCKFFSQKQVDDIIRGNSSKQKHQKPKVTKKFSISSGKSIFKILKNDNGIVVCSEDIDRDEEGIIQFKRIVYNSIYHVHTNDTNNEVLYIKKHIRTGYDKFKEDTSLGLMKKSYAQFYADLDNYYSHNRVDFYIVDDANKFIQDYNK